MLQEQRDLYDAARPHRRIFACDATQRFVKIYTRPLALPFGRVGWNMTGSECDANGDLIAARILAAPDGKPARDQYIANSESEVDIAAELDTARLNFALRVLRAARLADRAADAGELMHVPPARPGAPPFAPAT